MNTTTNNPYSLFSVIVKDLDYKDLKAQKNNLIKIQNKLEGDEWESLEGVLNLLDHIIDAIEEGKSDPPVQFACMRSDLKEKEIGIPIGDKCYFDLDPLPYRWINSETPEEQFQVFHEGEWKEAMSIDFEFI